MPGDSTFLFHFDRIQGYTAYYGLHTLSPRQSVTVSEWHVNATSTTDLTDHAQWLLIEQLDGAVIRLRSALRGMQYFNFDRHTPGSYIYSDKAQPAEFEVQAPDVPTAIHAPQTSDHPRAWYDLQGRALGTSPLQPGIYISDEGKKVVVR